MCASKKIVENIADQYFDGFCRGAKISKDDIIIRRDFLNLVGGNLTEAAIFSRIMYYQPYLKEKGRDELAKNHTEWQQECGVTSSAARKALKRLEDKLLISTRVGKFEGKNSVFIQVNRVSFYEQMTGEHLLQKDTSPVTKGQVHLLQKDRSIYKEDIQGIQQGKDSTAPVKPDAVKEPPTTIPEDDRYLLLQKPLDRLDSLRNESKLVKEPDERRNYKGYTKSPFYKQVERIFSYGCAVKSRRFKGYVLGQQCKWFHNEATGRDGQPATLTDLLDMMAWYLRETNGYDFPRGENFQNWWQQWKDKNPTVASIVQDFDNARANSGTSTIDAYLANYDAAMAKANKKGVA